MKSALWTILALAACAPAAGAGDLYRCTDGGAVLYTDQPCGDGSAPLANLPQSPPANTPAAPADAPQTDNSTNVDVDVNNNISLPAPPPTLEQSSNNGLELRVFRRLERGLSEGEVLAIAGPPDREVVDAVNTELGLQRKSYYYVSDGYNANVTRIRFTNGTVTDLERKLRPY